MAYVVGQDEELNGAQGSQQGQAPLVGAGSAVVGGQGANNAGVGKGGTGGYVNIQSYLNANPTDTGSAQALNKTVGSQFDQEAQNLHQNANDYVSGAQKQVDSAKISNDQADDIVNKSASLYDYGGNQNQDYQNNVSKVQGALNNKYAGPTSYSYGLTSQVQNYGNSLKDNGGFDQLMTNVYSNAAGKPLSGGQYQLQKQLDVNNAALGDTRNQLLNKYAGLEADRDNTVKGATDQLGGLAQQYSSNQNALRDYLGKRVNDYSTAQTQAEIDARKAYNHDLDENISPYKGSGLETRRDWLNAAKNNQVPDYFPEMAKFGQDHMAYSPLAQAGGDGLGGMTTDLTNQMRQTGTDFNNWYVDQAKKYADVGDPQKRAYNTIEDFLGQKDKKQSGFDVRS